LRKLVLLACVMAITVLAGFAQAQQIAQIDIAGGGSTPFSTQPNYSSQAFLPPPLKGGVYPGFSADVIFKNHFGINAEGLFRYHKGIYAGYQSFRPIFYDVNGMYVHRIAAKVNGDLLAGFGGESLIFYNAFGSCPSGACRDTLSTNHLVLHVGGDIRYYFWHHAFVRPEAHFYRIINNNEFSSSNFLRLGASVGYTFGR
jgi:hypothetical protein